MTAGANAIAATTPDAALAVRLKPLAPDAHQHIPALDVTITVNGPGVPAGQPILKMPLVTSNVESIAKTLTGLSAEDGQGPLSLTIVDDTGAGASRHWKADRATSGEVVVHYRAPISDILATRGAAPPLELRTDTGAFSGQGATFLLLPEAKLPWKLSVAWDLSNLAPGAIGVSSFGPGNVAPAVNGADEMGESYFMAGKVQVYPNTAPAAGFFSAWYGKPPFELHDLMASEQKLYSYYEKFFSRPSTAPYVVFMRENLVNAGGGVSLGTNSFVTTFGPKTDLQDVKITLAHEMLHTFAGHIDGDLESSWYGEGLAVYYARLLALRAGQITPDDFLKDLNDTAGRYYTNAMIARPNSEVAANFWLDTRIRVLPYDRGSMYFAVLDGTLRAASDGKVTLDTLLLAMLEREHRALPVNLDAWRALLKQHLGDAGVKQLDAMLSGAVMLPEAQGFGPCFTRTSKPMRRYLLGFEPAVLVEPKRIVRGLVAGSAAEKAGLRNGDAITKPVPQDMIQGQQNAMLTLEIQRDGKPLTITYLPRAETVDAYQWARTGNLPDSACAY
ncbi:M61 family metallopeptidase [Duganella guangzhouensis]|nr:peptidase M61 [Duganella guangzhouensis]